MQVLKFGGSSVSNAKNIERVIRLVNQSLQEDKSMVVVSALGGATDQLIEAAKLAAAQEESYKDKLLAFGNRHLELVRELLPVNAQSATLSQVRKYCNELESTCEGVSLLGELTGRSLDTIMSYGELLSSLIISSALNARGILHEWVDSRRIIRTDSGFGSARVDFKVTGELLTELLSMNGQNLYLFPGFIAADAQGLTTTLGRGGSDYSAAILAAESDAKILEIWTDVSGLMTADPRIVPQAKPIPRISYKEAMELSHFGAKVIYPPTIQPVMKKGIPVKVKNTFSGEEEGTLIEKVVPGSRQIARGISSLGNLVMISLEGSGLIGIPGMASRFFGALASARINVVFITQCSSEHAISVLVPDLFAEEAKAVIDAEFEPEIRNGKMDPVQPEAGVSILALVGDDMQNHPGISGKMFSALGRNGVNIRAIAQGFSEKNISAVISTTDVRKGLNALHEEFFETVLRQVNIFIAGLGNVGSRLLEQMARQQEFLQKQLRIQLRVVGITNSRKAMFNERGIDLKNWRAELDQGRKMSMGEFAENIRRLNLRNSVFADVTASNEVPSCYATLLRKSVSVVACNKAACSSEYKNYAELKQLAGDFNTAFLFETNVGASLPVIGTLKDLVRTGDKVNRIQAVLSGTLNYVFNNYSGKEKFAEVVRRAQAEGYTEPDPRLDLSGVDVMRKILILAREAGHVMELKDITNIPFLPAECMEGSVEDFYAGMAKHEAHFKKLFMEARKAGCKLKFVAEFEDGKAKVGLKHIRPEEDLYHLYGKDNIVLFYTERYKEQALVVKGAGAGAEVTASGLFADIMRSCGI